MDIKQLIPQREPFLFIQEIQSLNHDEIEVSMHFTPEMDFFKGHFPGNPIVPGVILTEHCFQSGAALISGQSEAQFKNSLAVVSRINSAKFKNIVRPGETIKTKTSLIERMGSAAFFKSVVSNQKNKKVLLLEFACTLVEDQA